MKKRLVASLAAAMVIGAAGSAFAAANPFVDVPAKHWSYDAVTKLAQAGIVDGYGDGKYQGDKVITRYEMAQIVAKAMAKSDKADAKQKAAIDKLAVEFADELNKIGVRVAALEANASTIKFTGDARLRWNNTENRAGSQEQKDRFRLNMTAKINDNTSVYARYIFTDGNYGGDVSRVTDLAFTTKNLISNTNVTVGRYSLLMGATGALADTTGDVEGIMTVTKSGDFGLMTGYAQARPASFVKNGLNIKNIAFVEGTYQMGKAKFVVDYFKNLNTGDFGIVDAYKIFGGGVTYVFDSNVKIATEYFKNSAEGVKFADGSSPKATLVRLTYKGASAAKPGSWGMYVENNKFEGNALPYGFQGPATKQNYADVGATTGLKSWVVAGNYAIAKNITAEAFYQFNIKDAKTGDDAASKTFTRAQVNFFF